ncbi:MAG TPA: amidohydrolase, partial [Agriterribacter sp.]|nr:amidohydrolase [Agriterribacter sp.]
MAYCKFQADQLFTGRQLLDRSHTLITDEKGTVLDIITEAAGEDVRYFSGILMPGHINCHCHLELSHMRN